MGEIGRTIRTRGNEHKRAIRNSYENHSGISKHVLETGHCIAWDDVKILAYESDWRKRKVKEGIFITHKKQPGFIVKHQTRCTVRKCLPCAALDVCVFFLCVFIFPE